jgi:hypothetical protein
MFQNFPGWHLMFSPLVVHFRNGKQLDRQLREMEEHEIAMMAVLE